MLPSESALCPCSSALCALKRFQKQIWKTILWYRFLVHEAGLKPSSEAVSLSLRNGDIDCLKLLFEAQPAQPAQPADPRRRLASTGVNSNRHNIRWKIGDLEEATEGVHRVHRSCDYPGLPLVP